MEADKQRIIQEYVPGKQVTLAHIIANPMKDVCKRLGLNDEITSAIGVMTITPSEASIIAADIATKASNVSIGFLDRFSGSLVIYGDVGSVEESVKSVNDVLHNVLKFKTTILTL